MDTNIWYIIIPIILIAYFFPMYFWMQHTFKHENTLNYYAFKRELESKKRTPMHYVEVTASIFLLIAILTTLVSQIQIWVSKKGQ